jgi:hypothetical protein
VISARWRIWRICPVLGWAAACGRSRRPSTKISEAMPVAARTSTEISPKVSHTRMSTSSTFTTFAPSPSS